LQSLRSVVSVPCIQGTHALRGLTLLFSDASFSTRHSSAGCSSAPHDVASSIFFDVQAPIRCRSHRSGVSRPADAGSSPCYILFIFFLAATQRASFFFSSIGRFRSRTGTSPLASSCRSHLILLVIAHLQVDGTFPVSH
jgi:hypothetical protein